MAAQARIDSEQATTALDEFLVSIADHIEKYGLNPTLPELQQLKARAEAIIKLDQKTGLNHRGVWLMRLDPYQYVKWYNGTLIIMQEAETSVLSPCSLIHYHLSSLDLATAIQKIVVDQTGTYIYAGDGRELVRCPAAEGDPNTSLRLGAQIVNNFTWLKVTPEELWQMQRATFSLTGNGWAAHTPVRTAA